MSFYKFKKDLKELKIEQKSIEKFVDDIDIDQNNFDIWIDNIFNDQITELDLNKLPYVIDVLFQSNDKFKFMLCCMLIESTCEDLPFITNLENHQMFKDKYDVLKNTLITVYERVDNGIANCMALIILNNDPKFELFNNEEKERVIKATYRKLKSILNYLEKNTNIDELIYYDIEVIIDLATYLNNHAIELLVDKISNYKLDFYSQLFIMKYKIVHNMKLDNKKIDELLNNKNELCKLVSVFEKVKAVDKLPLNRITQEEIARSNMIKWLEYPTELGKVPDVIELLGEFEFNNYMCYAYKFKSNDYKNKDYMLGVTGGYEKNKISSFNTGWTFSKFENLNDNYTEQAKELVDFIYNYFLERSKDNNKI